MVPARSLMLGCALLALPACQRAPEPVATSPAPTERANTRAFAHEQQAWQEQRRDELLRPDGWTSLIGLHWITPGPHFVGSAAGSGIRLALGPPELGMLDLGKDGALHFTPADGAALTLDDAPLGAASVLRSDADPAGPSRIGFDAGKGMATVIKRGERHALRVKHADAPERTGFKGLTYWPAQPDWKVEARYLPHAAGKTLQIANIIGSIDPVPNPGAVEFTRGGKRYRLEALDEGDGQLFVVFADRTNGRGSYGAGRFLEAAMPDASGRVVLDFNRSYNPPCAFTAFATCPLPPPENRLDLAVTAGEQAYVAPVH
jgi:uncharacterized protein (DUF1684 family)